ncbi:hypothetical protein [Comamonas sp. J-3]|uniref:hypothetical protein n=1 Tax=Comamonas trifloxystrobinivorans TaxID=3350256 RepID=UPI00372D2219
MMLGKIESALLYLMRLVMVLLVLFTLFTFVLWGVETLRPAKSETEQAEANKQRDWSAVKVSDEELKKITYSDFGYGDADQALNDGKLAADSAVVAAFAEVDTLLRTAIERNPEARKKLEQENGEAGLAPAKPLPEIIKALQASQSASYSAAAAVAAAATDATEESESDYQPQPTSIGEALLNQARNTISSYGYDAGRAFVLGAPAALKTLLADPQVQAGIDKQTASMVVSNLTLNYGMSFSNKASASEPSEKPRHGWLERLLEPSNLLVFTILLWSFVLMMMIVVFLRVERHLRAMAAEGKLLAQRKP